MSKNDEDPAALNVVISTLWAVEDMLKRADASAKRVRPSVRRGYTNLLRAAQAANRDLSAVQQELAARSQREGSLVHEIEEAVDEGLFDARPR